MNKFTVIFMAIYFASFIVASSAFVQPFASKSVAVDTHDSHSYGVVEHEIETSGHSELFATLANGLFEFFAKLVRAKVEILLWVKKTIISLLVSALSNLRYVMVHNADFVNGIIHTVAELLKIVLTEQPHYAVPHVSRLINSAEHNYIGHY